MKIVVEAVATNQFMDEYPNHASFEVTTELLVMIEKLQALCLKEDLLCVEKFYAPDEWDNQESLRMVHDSIVVNMDNFYFRANPKHSDCDVETIGIPVSMLKLIHKGKNLDTQSIEFYVDWKVVGDVVYIASCELALSDLTSCEETETSDEH